MGGKCPSCGKEDELNMRFCIYCSSPMSGGPPSVKPSDKFSWEVELNGDGVPKGATNAALSFKNAVAKAPSKKSLNYLPFGLAAGAALGLAMALVPGAQDYFLRVALSGAWQKQSLVVYTKHPFAQVTVYQPTDAKAFTMARTDSAGAVRFAQLEPGDYNVKISGKGLRTAFQQVTIVDGKATILGYEGALLLQSDPNAKDSGEDKPDKPEPSQGQQGNATKFTERPATEIKPDAATPAKPDSATPAKPDAATPAKLDAATPAKLDAATPSKLDADLKENPEAPGKPETETKVIQ